MYKCWKLCYVGSSSDQLRRTCHRHLFATPHITLVAWNQPWWEHAGKQEMTQISAVYLGERVTNYIPAHHWWEAGGEPFCYIPEAYSTQRKLQPLSRPHAAQQWRSKRGAEIRRALSPFWWSEELQREHLSTALGRALSGEVETGCSGGEVPPVPGSVTQSWPTLCNPMDCGPPGSSVHGIPLE